MIEIDQLLQSRNVSFINPSVRGFHIRTAGTFTSSPGSRDPNKGSKQTEKRKMQSWCHRIFTLAVLHNYYQSDRFVEVKEWLGIVSWWWHVCKEFQVYSGFRFLVFQFSFHFFKTLFKKYDLNCLANLIEHGQICIWSIEEIVISSI